MNYEEKILKAIEALQADLRATEHRLSKKIDQRSEEIMDAIADTADEIFKETGQRFDNIEDHLGLPHPTRG